MFNKTKLATFFIAINILISGFLISLMLNSDKSTEVISKISPKAAIVDIVSLRYPNETIIRTATNMLKQSGYNVDYYPGEEVTVKFYKNLPTRGYELIIFRVDSSMGNPDSGRGPVVFFTSERYNKSKYLPLQLTDQVVIAAFSKDGIEKGDTYFGITPYFVTRMNGKFENTVIFMMGCDGLSDTSMAKAFIEKGASVYIGWKKPVAGDETDTTTIQLLQHLLIEKTTLEESVRRTFKGDGNSSEYKLTYYPPEMGRQTIEDLKDVKAH